MRNEKPEECGARRKREAPKCSKSRVRGRECDIYRRAARRPATGESSYRGYCRRKIFQRVRPSGRSSFGYTATRAITCASLLSSALVKIAHCVWVQAERCSSMPALFSVLEYRASRWDYSFFLSGNVLIAICHAQPVCSSTM